MKVGLYDIDSKIPNLALMKLSAHHKQKGDQVEFYKPLFHNTYDKVYTSKIFTFTENKYIRPDMICGGSGFDFLTILPEEIEHIYPDYELYNCNYALGFLTRGCSRKCPWCIVWKKEGDIRFNAPLEEFCTDQHKVKLLDNNILAYTQCLDLLEILSQSKKSIDFNQGLDIRYIDKTIARAIKEIKRWKGIRYRFSLDDTNLIPVIKHKLDILNNAGISNNSCQFYILIGFNSTPKDDMKRINFLKSQKCAIFVMPYNKFNIYQRKFGRWINRYFYKYQSFKDYCKK